MAPQDLDSELEPTEPSVDIVYVACFLVDNDNASIPTFAPISRRLPEGLLKVLFIGATRLRLFW